MKVKITKAEYDKLSDHDKKSYKKGEGDDEYIVDMESVSKRLTDMDSKITELLDEKKKTQKERDDAAEAARLAKEDKAKREGDIQALEQSWQEKLDKAVGEKETEIKNLTGILTKQTSGMDATNLANKLAVPGKAGVLMPHISSRLKTEFTEGKTITRVLDADGNPSALSINDLENEFRNNELFASVIQGSNGSGAGHKGGDGDAGSDHGKTKMLRSEFDSKPLGERHALMKEGNVQLVDEL